MTLLPGVTSSLTTIEAKLRNSNYNLWRRVLVVLSSSSIFIALNGCLKTFFSYNLYGAQVSYPLIIATFLVIYSVYGLNKITDTEEDQLNAPERSNLISSHQKLFTYSSVAAYILAVVIGILHGWQVILVLLFPLLAGVIY
ncbi:MAG: prenyltransferase, partial [Methanobacterium sp.]|nr:prenyltransferase [Methanobacterium sp.]